MSKKAYDYVVEMMKEYHPDDGIKKRCIINYDAIAEGLCIATRSERKPVSLKEQFILDMYNTKNQLKNVLSVGSFI